MIGGMTHLEFDIILCQYGVYDEWDLLSLVLRTSVLMKIAARIDIAHSTRLLHKRRLFSHQKPEVYYPRSRLRSRLSKPTFSSLYNP
jgi:hypothetical protein